MTATDELRRMLDERGVEHFDNNERTLWGCGDYYPYSAVENFGGSLNVHTHAYDLTPEQAIAATLGNQYGWNHPEWVEWVDGLNHREVKSIRDAVEQLMYEAITLGGSMGPNDNIEDGWNEGTELTKKFTDWWVEKFATLGAGTCHVESSIIDTYEYNRWEYELSCGHAIIWEDSEPPRYCPNCGRRIEQ